MIMKQRKILIHNMTFNGIHAVPGVIDYDQRGIVFAEGEDLVVTNSKFDEDYLDYLGSLGYPVDKIEYLHPEDSSKKTWNSIFSSETVKNHLRSIRNKDKYLIDVYIPTKFDGELSETLGIKHCNNYLLSEKYGTKSGFRQLIKEADLPAAGGYGGVENVAQVRECLAKLFQKGFQMAVVKVDDGISGYGNAIFSQGEFIESRSLSEKEFFNRYLKPIRWDVTGKGVVEGWIKDVVNSLSVLMKVQDGSYNLVCLQDQLLIKGDKWAGCYYPSSISTKRSLLTKLNRIIDKSARYLVDKGFWGYFSFDVLETTKGDLYLVEANMRKIGSFYPRVFVDWVIRNEGFKSLEVAYVASDYTNPDAWKGKRFGDVKRRLKGMLWPRKGKNKGVLIYNTGAILNGGRFDFITVSDALIDAKKMREEIIRELNLLIPPLGAGRFHFN